ncbi:Hypothetical predicted protein [Olea europaea subsp. europaea]|uniref:Uncharacterized protein n=1 Tax=Olea europaea subsp. europaea TaxID=158383 RepID=A0A8S0UNV6_OLEEU|nr:Hypothetical predicted protein [Olea europaea subsp. europaea]
MVPALRADDDARRSCRSACDDVIELYCTRCSGTPGSSYRTAVGEQTAAGELQTAVGGDRSAGARLPHGSCGRTAGRPAVWVEQHVCHFDPSVGTAAAVRRRAGGRARVRLARDTPDLTQRAAGLRWLALSVTRIESVVAARRAARCQPVAPEFRQVGNPPGVDTTVVAMGGRVRCTSSSHWSTLLPGSNTIRDSGCGGPGEVLIGSFSCGYTASKFMQLFTRAVMQMHYLQQEVEWIQAMQ